MIQLRNLSLRRGGRLLLSGVDLRLQSGQKVGIVGANGCGKSSLFALLLGELQPDVGEAVVPEQWVIAHVAQQTPAGTRSALDLVMDGDQELRLVQAELAAAEARGDGLRQAELHGRLEAIGGYEAASRAGRLLHGLGFAPADEQRPVDSFSGGWRMRLALARALMCRSDLLLLDEPTNHLDLDAVIWLETWLRSYPGTLLLISHDREFLDAIAGHILHIEHGQMWLYTGDYSAFERQRAERLAHQHTAYERQQRAVAEIQRFVERFRAKASKARQAQSRLKALERMEEIAPAHVDTPFRFDFPVCGDLPHPLLRLDEVATGYAEHRVLTEISLSLAPGDRIGLLGRNGAGKSTLVKLLAGHLPVLSGRFEMAQDLKIGYFAQHQLDQLRTDETPLDHLRHLDPRASEQDHRDFLGGFGFSGDRALEPVAPLSGGEKARLALALLVRQAPSLLLLDEPTNHLDIEMRHALATAVQAYEGALVIVSHDRHLLRVTTDRLLLVDEGGVSDFRGDLDEYPAWLAEQSKAQERPKAALEPSLESRKAQRQRDALARQRLQPLKRRLADLEQELGTLAGRRRDLERALASPELYQPEAKARLLALLEDKRQLDGALEQVETEWLVASEELERAESAVAP